MRKRLVSCLTVLLMITFLLTGAQAEKTTTFHTPFEIVSHLTDFAYQVTNLSAVSDQEVQAQVTIYALQKDVIVNIYTFALYDPQLQYYYYPYAVNVTNTGAPVSDLVIPPGGGDTFTFRVAYQNSQYAALYWVCLCGTDRFSCTQFAYMPPTQAAAYGYSTADEFFNPGYSAGSTYANPYGNTANSSDWNYSYAPVDDFFSATSIDFSSTTGSPAYTSGSSTGSYVTCFPCKGTGECSLCDGKGRLHIGTSAECTCPSCYGDGECAFCHGSGMLKSELH